MTGNLATDLNAVQTGYEFNRDSVERLMQFDSIVLTTVDEMLARLENDLQDKRANIAIGVVQNHRKIIANIRRNESVTKYYDTMLNQCVVLLVSHFASAIHDALRAGVLAAWRHGYRFPVGKPEIKLKLADLWLGQDEQRRAEHIVDLAIDQPGVSFQDMQSIARTFEEYLEVQTPQGPFLDDIIVGQATRHSIVHSGGKIDAKLLKQIGKRSGYRLHLRLEGNAQVQYERDDVRALSESTMDYLIALLASIRQTVPGESP